MSDPRDSSSDGSEDLAGGDAVDAGSAAGNGDSAARPSGKRAARRSRPAGDSSPSNTTAGTSVATASRVAGRTRAEATPKMNVFKRLRKFLREVVAELRKVIWPTRRELITYTWVVIAFVTVMALFVAALDLLFGRAALAVFGGG